MPGTDLNEVATKLAGEAWALLAASEAKSGEPGESAWLYGMAERLSNVSDELSAALNAERGTAMRRPL